MCQYTLLNHVCDFQCLLTVLHGLLQSDVISFESRMYAAKRVSRFHKFVYARQISVGLEAKKGFIDVTQLIYHRLIRAAYSNLLRFQSKTIANCAK